MSVKNSAAALMLLSLLGFANTAQANTTVPPSATGGVRGDITQHMTSIFEGISFVVNRMKYTLNPADQQTHIKAVIFAAQSLDNGEMTEWSNPANNTAAMIKIIMTKPVQGGYCRLLFTQVEIGQNIREYQEYACKTMDSEYWTFYSR